MNISATNYAFLWASSFAEGCDQVAALGLESIEFTAALPHLDLEAPLAPQATEIRRAAANAGLTFTSVNPVDLNLISSNAAIAQASLNAYHSCIDLAQMLDAPMLVVVPGRMGLSPMTVEVAHKMFTQAITQLAFHAEEVGITLAVENVPFGFLQTPSAVLEQLLPVGSPALGLTVDLANLHYLNVDAHEELRTVADYIRLAHISDTTQKVFAHAHLGDGDMDAQASIEALRAAGFTGNLVNELVVPNVNWQRWAEDINTLQAILGTPAPLAR